MCQKIGMMLLIFLLVLSCPVIYAQQSADLLETGVDEKLGNFIPLDLKFVDENGDSVQLKQFINKPTILALVYYRCPGICSPLLSGIVDVVDKIDNIPGEDFVILTVSFDETDNPTLGAQKKKNYLAAFNKPFPSEHWKFLTGDRASIKKLTDAVGFRFKKQGRDFVHPGLITIIGKDGIISRYLFGISYLPFDLKMALLEASQGRTGPTINRVLLYCFSYDPDGKKYAFNFLKVTGTIILFFLLFFVVFLIFSGRSRKRKARATNVS